MSTLMITDSCAVRAFAAAFSSPYTAADIAPALSCEEADALAGLLRAIGEPETAGLWEDAHARADEEGDRHYRQPAQEYVVPVDPMELLQCDSCQ